MKWWQTRLYCKYSTDVPPFPTLKPSSSYTVKKNLLSILTMFKSKKINHITGFGLWNFSKNPSLSYLFIEALPKKKLRPKNFQSTFLSSDIYKKSNSDASVHLFICRNILKSWKHYPPLYLIKRRKQWKPNQLLWGTSFWAGCRPEKLVKIS